MKYFITFLFIFVCNHGFSEQNLIAEFLDNQIDIDVGFTGKKLSYFGAIDTKEVSYYCNRAQKKIKFLKKKKVWFWINSNSRVFRRSIILFCSNKQTFKPDKK